MRRFVFVLVVLAALLPAVARAELPVPVVLIPGWHGEPAAFDRARGGRAHRARL
jgi:hypothetical protein